MEVEDKELRGGAESVLNLAQGSSISIRYHSLFGDYNDLLLLEADEAFLPDILQNRVTIRGQTNEEAVLCTPSATYAMKSVGTSNSVFLIPPGKPILVSVNDTCSDNKANPSAVTEEVSSIIKVASTNMELVLVAPSLDKLKSLLHERPYKLNEDLEVESRGNVGLYRWHDLLEQIQASEQELKDGLKLFSAVEIDGFWRVIDGKTMDEILSMVLNNSILQGWPLNALKEDEVVSVLETDGYPQKIILHCLETFGIMVEGSDGKLWSLDEKKVCLHFALVALGGGMMKLDIFLQKWKHSVPSGMQADLKMLEGEVLYEKLGFETWIHAFRASALPSSPAMRFAALFRERSKWEWKDLEPYIRDLRVPGLSLEGLLIKYTRRTQPSADVEPIFSASVGDIPENYVHQWYTKDMFMKAYSRFIKPIPGEEDWPHEDHAPSGPPTCNVLPGRPRK
ncbi:sister chromatid cohesion protein DCC1 [Canna indica]|uniref:Sister chromatid cohesion protein DCC1 n=1 Tax=Canna indica TaxID=4628 RepID=A0AAQ3JWS1_9LILI|nr:sister chromatid cohesion protein DCC1 [Canna indica]